MDSSLAARLLGAAFAALAGLILAWLFGAGLSGALVAFIAGGGAVALVSAREQPPEIEEKVAPPAGPSLPSSGDMIEGFDNPALIVQGRRVLLSNAAARKVLGDHIDGVDVRLAIRHPAAAALLTEESTAPFTRTDLAGLGEHDRRWEMTTALLGDGSRLVRLADTSDAFAAEKMRGDFVANASHELRTPLATLLGFVETLQDDKAAGDPKTRARFLGIMDEEARRMQRLIDDLISLSRIEAERYSAPREAVPLLKLAEDVRAASAQIIEQQGATLLVEHEGEEPVALGDRAQLSQLLQNLVANALKYGRPGTPVTIRFEEGGGDMLRVQVRDEGEGISPEHLPRLTERFYRIDAGRSRAVGGTGLGLAIVKHIVGRHRGRLEIDSKPGEGTTVTVLLPKAKDDAVI